MENPPHVALRPNRLPLAVHVLVVSALSLSFVSGVMMWKAQANGQPSRSWAVFHGALNPLLAALFGYLLCDHIRLGWQNKVNRGTGLLMELVFATLLVSGTGVYYAPEGWQRAVILVHRGAGCLVPLSLAAHWIAGIRHGRQLQKELAPETQSQ